MELPRELTLATVGSVLPAADALAASGTLDLGGVARADSAGIALLLELTRRARAQGRELKFSGASAQLHGLVRFFELESALPLG